MAKKYVDRNPYGVYAPMDRMLCTLIYLWSGALPKWAIDEMERQDKESHHE